MRTLTRWQLAVAAFVHENSIRYWEVRGMTPGRPPYAIDCIEQALTILGVIAFADPYPRRAFVSDE